jgi:hypothetical protein
MRAASTACCWYDAEGMVSIVLCCYRGWWAELHFERRLALDGTPIEHKKALMMMIGLVIRKQLGKISTLDRWNIQVFQCDVHENRIVAESQCFRLCDDDPAVI